MPLGGRPMVAWSADAFRAAGVGAIVAAAPAGHLDAVAEALGGEATVVEGGDTRSASVANALQQVENELVAVHDAARPLLTAELVRAVVGALEADPGAAGAIAACPVTDTIKQVADPPLAVERTVDRTRLWAAQTPQAFRLSALREALEGDPGTVAAATDEAMIVEAAGGRVLIRPSLAENLKVTTPLDLQVAERLLAQ